MNCPKCPGVLKEIVVEGVTVEICWLCQGIWFDEKEMEKIISRDMKNFRLGDLDSLYVEEPDVARSQKAVDQKNGLCPRCKSSLKKEKYPFNKNLEIDTCSKCSGMWLDGDEIHLLRDRTLANAVKKWDAFVEWMADTYRALQRARAGDY